MHSYIDEELVDGERLGLEIHLTGCHTCAHRTQIERHNLTLIRSAGQEGSPVAHEALRLRIHQAIAGRQRASLARLISLVSAAAAGVAFLAIAANQGWHLRQRQLFVDEAARRYARQLPLEIHGQPEALEAWFGGKLDHRVTVPHFAHATTAGARLTNVRDREAAYIRYDAPRANSAEPRHMGLFVFDGASELGLSALPGSDISSSHGYNVISWRQGDVVYELVTDLDETDVRALMPSP